MRSRPGQDVRSRGNQEALTAAHASAIRVALCWHQFVGLVTRFSVRVNEILP